MTDHAPSVVAPATLRELLGEALAEWDAIEGSSLSDQFRAFIAAGKMADAIRAAAPEPVHLRFGQEVILDTGPKWGGEDTLIVGWVERSESLSVSGQFVSSGASREYVLQDGMDAPSQEALDRVYRAAAAVEEA